MVGPDGGLFGGRDPGHTSGVYSAVLFVVLLVVIVGGIGAAAIGVILFLGVRDDVRLTPRAATPPSVEGP